MMLFKRQEGFTLVELLIVVVIIGILAAVAVPKFMDSVRQTQRETCRNNLSQLETSIANWYSDATNASAVAAPPQADLVTANFLKRVVNCPTKAVYLISGYDTVECPKSATLSHSL